MTTNESFKRRVRARMTKTGEKYGAARRVLIEQAAHRARHGRASEPGHPDDLIRERTGRTWDEWREVIDASPLAQAGHTAVATWLH